MKEEEKYEIGSEYSAYFDDEHRNVGNYKPLDTSRYQDHTESHGSISWLPKLFLILSLIALITYAICRMLQ